MIVLPGKKALLLLGLILALLALVPLFADTFILKLTTRILILAIFAMSLDLLIGYTGLVSFGHAAFFGLSAYSLHLISPEYEAANLVWVLPVCIAISAAAAAAIGALTVRTKGIYFIMVTLAFAQMLFFLFHDTKIAGGSDGAYIFVKPTLDLLGVRLLNFEDRVTFFYVCMAFLVLSYALLVMVLRSPFGQVVMGIKVNEHRMLALGYNTYVYKLVSFVIAGAFAGLAGFLFACIDGFVSPELLSWRESGIAIMVVILGGMGTLFGPILGAIGFAGAEEIFKDRHLVFFMAEHWQILMGVFVIAVALLLPNGLASLLLRTPGARGKVEEPGDG